jgi:hypothetical protein
MRDWIGGFAENFEREVEQRPWWWLGFFTILYACITVLNAARKALWFDELFTFYVAGLPRLPDLWSALASGFDPNPPLPYLLTRFAHGLVGSGPLGTRLPAMLGFWLMCMCLFFFVRRRTSALHGAVAMALPLVTTAYEYAYEARGYGLVLGGSALALLCWQSVQGRRRRIALAGLALGLALSVSSHYHAVLIICALGLGEVSRSRASRRFDLPVWLALGGGLTPLVPYSPLIRSGMRNVLSYSLGSEQFWTKPTLARIPEYYIYLLYPALPVAVLSLGLLAIASRLGILDRIKEVFRRDEGPPLHELLAAGGFLIMPVFLFIVAKVMTGYYMDRYALSAVVGCAAMTGFGLHQTARGRHIVGVVLLGGTLSWFVVAQFLPKNQPYAFRGPVLDTTDSLYPGADDQPIAMANALQFLQTHYYGSPEVVSRIYYLSDPQKAVRKPDFIAELALLGLRRWIPIKVEDYTSFLAAHRSFWVYHNSLNQVEWLIAQLAADGWRVELRGQDRDLLLFLVTRREPRSQGLGQPARIIDRFQATRAAYQ